MMNKLTMVPLDLIQPNPWQPRQQEDAEHIKALALSIATDGLLQVPVGREVDGKIELAFGHSRLAAYKWLRDVQPNSNIPGDWSTMPVMVRDISDEEMFRLAVSENVQRRDLSPIEEARAMQRYRDEFGKTSKEIGELFGMAESTVRNKMRLVELPEAAQKVLEEGSITENGARRLQSKRNAGRAGRKPGKRSGNIWPASMLAQRVSPTATPRPSPSGASSRQSQLSAAAGRAATLFVSPPGVGRPGFGATMRQPFRALRGNNDENF